SDLGSDRAPGGGAGVEAPARPRLGTAGPGAPLGSASEAEVAEQIVEPHVVAARRGAAIGVRPGGWRSGARADVALEGLGEGSGRRATLVAAIVLPTAGGIAQRLVRGSRRLEAFLPLGVAAGEIRVAGPRDPTEGPLDLVGARVARQPEDFVEV